METKNAIIESASIMLEENGILSAYLTLNYGGCCQGFGGYALYLPKSFTHYCLRTVAGHFIYRVMKIADVTKWSDLVGKTVRVQCTFDKVHAIGHIVKNDWFNPVEDFKE